MKLDISRYQDISVDELVVIGNESREALLQCLTDIQAHIGKDSEIHPDFFDAIFDALDILGWDQGDFIEEWVGRG